MNVIFVNNMEIFHKLIGFTFPAKSFMTVLWCTILEWMFSDFNDMYCPGIHFPRTFLLTCTFFQAVL